MKNKILNYLNNDKKGASPTTIGLALGYDYNSASSSVMYGLKQLVNENLVSRTQKDNKIIYKIK